VNQFKTARGNKNWEKEIPTDLLKVIKASLKMHPRNYLFAQKSGEPYMNANSFQKNSNSVLKKVFKNNKVSVNSLRHSFRTFRSKGALTVNELKEDAHNLGHSLETSLKYTFIDRKK
jgi:integrase